MFGRKEKPKPIVVTDLLHAHDLLLHPGSESVIPSLTYILSTIRSQPSLCHTFSYKLVALVVQVGLYGSVGDEEERIQKSDALKQKLCLCILIELYRGNPEGRYTDYGTRDNISLTRDTHDLPVGGDGSDNHNSVSGYLVYSKVMSWVMKTLGAGCATEVILTPDERQTFMLCWQVLSTLPTHCTAAILCNKEYSQRLRACTLMVDPILRAVSISALGTLLLPVWHYLHNDDFTDTLAYFGQLDSSGGGSGPAGLGLGEGEMASMDGPRLRDIAAEYIIEVYTGCVLGLVQQASYVDAGTGTPVPLEENIRTVAAHGGVLSLLLQASDNGASVGSRSDRDSPTFSTNRFVQAVLHDLVKYLPYLITISQVPSHIDEGDTGGDGAGNTIVTLVSEVLLTLLHHVNHQNHESDILGRDGDLFVTVIVKERYRFGDEVLGTPLVESLTGKDTQSLRLLFNYWFSILSTISLPLTTPGSDNYGWKVVFYQIQLLEGAVGRGWVGQSRIMETLEGVSRWLVQRTRRMSTDGHMVDADELTEVSSGVMTLCSLLKVEDDDESHDGLLSECQLKIFLSTSVSLVSYLHAISFTFLVPSTSMGDKSDTDQNEKIKRREKQVVSIITHMATLALHISVKAPISIQAWIWSTFLGVNHTGGYAGERFNDILIFSLCRAMITALAQPLAFQRADPTGHANGSYAGYTHRVRALALHLLEMLMPMMVDAVNHRVGETAIHGIVSLFAAIYDDLLPSSVHPSNDGNSDGEVREKLVSVCLSLLDRFPTCGCHSNPNLMHFALHILTSCTLPILYALDNTNAAGPSQIHVDGDDEDIRVGGRIFALDLSAITDDSEPQDAHRIIKGAMGDLDEGGNARRWCETLSSLLQSYLEAYVHNLQHDGSGALGGSNGIYFADRAAAMISTVSSEGDRGAIPGVSDETGLMCASSLVDLCIAVTAYAAKGTMGDSKGAMGPVIGSIDMKFAHAFVENCQEVLHSAMMSLHAPMVEAYSRCINRLDIVEKRAVGTIESRKSGDDDKVVQNLMMFASGCCLTADQGYVVMGLGNQNHRVSDTELAVLITEHIVSNFAHPVNVTSEISTGVRTNKLREGLHAWQTLPPNTLPPAPHPARCPGSLLPLSGGSDMLQVSGLAWYNDDSGSVMVKCRVVNAAGFTVPEFRVLMTVRKEAKSEVYRRGMECLPVGREALHSRWESHRSADLGGVSSPYLKHALLFPFLKPNSDHNSDGDGGSTILAQSSHKVEQLPVDGTHIHTWSVKSDRIGSMCVYLQIEYTGLIEENKGGVPVLWGVSKGATGDLIKSGNIRLGASSLVMCEPLMLSFMGMLRPYGGTGHSEGMVSLLPVIMSRCSVHSSAISVHICCPTPYQEAKECDDGSNDHGTIATLIRKIARRSGNRGGDGPLSVTSLASGPIHCHRKRGTDREGGETLQWVLQTVWSEIIIINVSLFRRPFSTTRAMEGAKSGGDTRLHGPAIAPLDPSLDPNPLLWASMDYFRLSCHNLAAVFADTHSAGRDDAVAVAVAAADGCDGTLTLYSSDAYTAAVLLEDNNLRELLMVISEGVLVPGGSPGTNTGTNSNVPTVFRSTYFN